MKAVLLVIALGPCLAAGRGAHLSAVTPVQKVVQLLGGMLEKGKGEKQAEQVQFAVYKRFCEDTTEEKQNLVSKANDRIEVLTADIEKHAADAARLGDEIAGHDEDTAVWNGDSKAATKVREIEKADYDATHKDYSEAVDALKRALEVLKKQAYDRKQSAFTQLTALKVLSLIPPHAKRAIDAFISQDPVEGLAVTAPQADGYEFQSHGIIDVLEKLLDKFISERTELEKEESDGRHAYELLTQELQTQIQESTQDREEKAALKAKKLQARADAEGSLTDTTTTRDDDQKYLGDLTATCEQKASEFESRQDLRTKELEAIEQAIQIISRASVAGNADKHLPALLQGKGRASALAQLRADLSGKLRARLAQYLHDQATRINSRVLANLALHVADDPFQKVKKMIQDLITRLQQEANEEAEHKGWCDTELGTNEQTRKAKTQAVETLHAEIDELEASVSKVTNDVAALTAAVADLDAAMAKATQLRQEEKAANAATIKDAQEAQTALAQALAVLMEFYAKAAEATSFVQQQPVPPPIFDSPYKGMQAENGGVISMLELIQSDFARLESETKSAEVSAQQEYEQFTTDTKVDKAAKSRDIEHKTAKIQDESQALTQKKSDVEATQKELTAAIAYFDKLKPSCIDAGVTYEDRSARRKEEIESLREALRILNGEDLA